MYEHRVDRVPGFLSSRPNWLPRPLTSKRVQVQGGGHTRLRERGGGGANSDEWTDTLVQVQYNPSTMYELRTKQFILLHSYQVLQKSHGLLTLKTISWPTLSAIYKIIQAILGKSHCLVEESQGHFKQYHDTKLRPLQAIKVTSEHDRIRQSDNPFKQHYCLFQAVSTPLQAISFGKYIANTGSFLFFLIVYCVV